MTSRAVQTTHDNHFVPQWYLKQWCGASGLLWCYRLLVSHRSVPVWQQRRPRGIAFRRDLYTTVQHGSESDEFERWVESEFERPAQVAIRRVVENQPLQPQHWQHLGRYALCQQLRTPQDFLESRERWDREFPGLLERSLREAVQTMEECHREGRPLPERSVHHGENLRDGFEVFINPDAHPETGEGEIGVSVVLGREFWLAQQRHLLEGVGWIAARHSWAIAEPSSGAVWSTSDQPVVRLNYRADGFDLKGGWGRMRANILMPLSPRHLLLTQVGEELPPRIMLGEEPTGRIQEILVRRAHRMVFADRRLDFVQKLRPRVVDAEQYQAEEDSWADWHRQQASAHE